MVNRVECHSHSASKYSSSAVSSRGSGGTGKELIRGRLALMLSIDICRFRLAVSGWLMSSDNAEAFVWLVSCSASEFGMERFKLSIWNWAMRLFSSRWVSSSKRRMSASVKPWYSSCQHQAWRCARRIVLRRAGKGNKAMLNSSVPVWITYFVDETFTFTLHAPVAKLHAA